MGETAPFWRFSAASYPDLEGTRPVDAVMSTQNGIVNPDPTTSLRVCLYKAKFMLSLLLHIYSTCGNNLSTCESKISTFNPPPQ